MNQKMRIMKQITNNIYYVGVNDRNKNLFEGLWPLPAGVSYNAYLIDDEKTCLIDTVEVDFFMPFIENVRQVLGERELDYLVVNHMEPDHSGSLALIRKYYPGVQIIGNKKTFDMLRGFYQLEEGLLEVKNGDTLSLGAQQLQFVQERQGKFLVAVPLYIHGKTGLIILRLQVVSDKFRKTLFKTVNLIAFQSQTGSLTVAPELDQVSGTGVKRIIHVQGLDAAAGPFGHIAADTDQNHRTVVFIYQPGCNNADYTGMPSLLRV